jgi:hypothetical protein
VRVCAGSFLTLEGTYLLDTREEHATEPPTVWFISQTSQGRKLKVVFIARKVGIPGGGRAVNVEIKTAYGPNEKEIEIYARRGTC